MYRATVEFISSILSTLDQVTYTSIDLFICITLKSWLHSGISIWAPTSWIQRML